MEATVLSVGKSVLNGALGYARSAVAEEVALQLGVRRDQLFITNELEMMQAFLMAAHDDDDDDGNNQVVKVWVKQVRDVAYDVEDSLQDFAVRLDRQSSASWWWRIRRALLDQRHVAKQMKDLRSSVEDVSQRNMRYQLIGSKRRRPTAANITSAALLFGIDQAIRCTARRRGDDPRVDLLQLLNNEENNDLVVISVWGTSADLGRQTSIIRAAYDNPDSRSKFPCRAWVRLAHPFDPKGFIQSSVKQFDRTLAGANSLLGADQKTSQELADEFNGYVDAERYLIVLNDLSTIEEWDQVQKCFPDNKLGSRIIVSTSQVEVAGLCAGQESVISELKKLSADQIIYAFHREGSQDGTYLTEAGSSSNNIATTNSTDDKYIVPTSEILEDQAKGANTNKVAGKSLSCIRTMVAVSEESHVVGRVEEKNDIIKLITNQATTQRFQVISVWGMGGLGKTTLIEDVYQSQDLNGAFEKRACITIMRPFNLEELIRTLVMQLDRESSEKKEVMDLMGSTDNTLILMPLAELIKELAKLIEKKRCLIVLDDVSSAAEWNMIVPIFHEIENTSKIIVTTREENIAKHCSGEQENYVYMLKGLEYKDARGLFTKKVFGKTTDLDEEYPELVEQANQILRKCSGLPLAVVTIGGFLANQPKTTLEWMKLNEHISAELEMNPKLGIIRTVLTKSYDGLPYYLKSCFLYMPIFPEDFKIERRRLVRRWTAEGYSREVRGKSVEEISDGYFMELISRSMILPSQQSIHSIKGIDSCQVHDLMREIGISKSMEENLVFRLEEGCNSNTQGTTRHLAIDSNWKGDQTEFESIVDMSRVRSVTVFGKWRPFFISDKMSMLRVLDLEDTTGLRDHHVKHIGKLLHLRYLSLRGCNRIFHLPNSLGNLRQLETLDIRGTKMIKLPKSIVKLEKLTYLCVGRKSRNEGLSYQRAKHTLAQIARNKLRVSSSSPLLVCVVCYRLLDNDGMNHRDVCTLSCSYMLSVFAVHLELHGVVVPRGMRKLKALRALGVVNITRGNKYALKDIKRLTQLRKLGVTGINEKNSQELCSTIAGLSSLESLLIRSEGEPGLLGCLDSIKSCSSEKLQSLKLYGNLVVLPEWIKGLNTLVKLKLRSTMISDADTAMDQVLGNLPNLASLHLLGRSFHGEKGLCLNFHSETFLSLQVLELELDVCHSRSVMFEHGATPKLELLKFVGQIIDSDIVSGLPYLSGLKEVVLQGEYSFGQLEYLEAELAKNPNKPLYKRI